MCRAARAAPAPHPAASITYQTARTRSTTHLLHPGEVGPQRLLDAAVVRDVLALGVDAVEVHGGAAPEVHAVVAVLVDDALRLLQILPLGLRLPPVNQVTLRVLLAALVVEVSTKLRECFRNKVIKWVF